MSCCPSPPPTSKISEFTPDENNPSSSTNIRPDEPIECYASRTGNPTGLNDDATDYKENKIENSNIAVIRGSSVGVNEKFKLTSNSTSTAASWEYSPTISGISFSGNVLSGNFNSSDYGTTFKIKVTAKDASGAVIDSRTFTVTPTKESSGDVVKFISPLPGGIVTSPFGMRVHPIQKIEKMHNGIDLAMPNKSVIDVVAAADGEVVFAGTSGGAGNYVKISHKDSSGKVVVVSGYMHLQSIYVSVGQKVMAGQKIGKEGNTGASKGNHLHFEAKTPAGKYIDPLPLLKGGASVASKTNQDGSADPSSIERVPDKNASVSAKETSAKDNCPPSSGSTAPSNPENPNPETGMPEETPPSQNTPKSERDIFEFAWDITMRWEVGPHWKTAPQYSPGDSDLEAGSCDTEIQKKKCGFKMWSKSLGGATKFGISSSTGLNVSVRQMTYQQCKSVGYNNYWKSPKSRAQPSNLSSKNPYIAVLLFDMLFMSWTFGGQIWESQNLGSLPPKTKAEQLEICEQMTLAHLSYLKQVAASKGKTFPLEGTSSRVIDRMKRVRSLSL